jgi:predicted nucleotidyltransferase component of viral defense system
MTPRYPLAFEGIPAWASTQQLSVAEARTRFAQYAILRAIAGSRTLAAILVFKGGNALDFVWQPNRSTRDLDFTMDMAVRRDPIDLEHLREIFVRSLAVSTRELAVALQVQRVRQQPPGLEKTFITYDVRVGYALPDEQPLRDRMQSGQSSTRVIPLEIAMNEVIGDAEVVALDATHQLRVCTVEDIVAEKLRALLQQPLRNRLRPQDLLDIAVVLQGGADLDPDRVARFLLAKARARGVAVSRAAFHHPEVARRAFSDYDALRLTTRARFIPADEALSVLYAFIDTLPIPERETMP